MKATSPHKYRACAFGPIGYQARKMIRVGVCESRGQRITRRDIYGVSGVEFIDTQHRCAGEIGTPRPQGHEVLVWSTGPKALSPEADNQQCQANAIESPRRSNDRPHFFSHRLPQQKTL